LLPAARSPADYLRVVDDPRLNDSGLGVLAGSPYSFVRLAVAGHQRARAAHLLRLLDGEYTDWDHNALLLLVARHAGADRPVLRAVLGRAAELLRAGARPYAAVLALAAGAIAHPWLIQAMPRHMRTGKRRWPAAAKVSAQAARPPASRTSSRTAVLPSEDRQSRRPGVRRTRPVSRAASVRQGVWQSRRRGGRQQGQAAQ
jgi:hypothetical protein